MVEIPATVEVMVEDHPEVVVEAVLRGLRRRERLVIPGAVSRATSLFTRLAPRGLLTVAVGKALKG